MARPVRIALIGAGTQLGEVAECKKILDALQGFEVEHRYQARFDEFEAALRRQRPDVVHLCAHGDEGGELYFSAEHGQTRPVPPALLQSSFSALLSPRSCVVLSACHSFDLARALAGPLALAVGIEGVVDASACQTFAGAFYSDLANGTALQAAFDSGRRSLEHAHLDAASSLHLYGADSMRARCLSELTIDLSELVELLQSSFNADELLHWLGRGRARSLLAELPCSGASLHQLCHSTVELLDRRGYVDHVLFDELREQRPRRTEQIEALRHELLGLGRS